MKIRNATCKDISSIIKIQANLSLLRLDPAEKLTARRGFIVHLMDKTYLENLIYIGREFLGLVCEVEGEVVGYALGMSIKRPEVTIDWASGVTLTNTIRLAEIFNDTTLYYGQVAMSPASLPGLGARLSKEFLEFAKSMGYRNIVGEILKEPVENKISAIIHRRLGFIEIGHVDEIYQGRLYKWALVAKNLFSLPVS